MMPRVHNIYHFAANQRQGALLIIIIIIIWANHLHVPTFTASASVAFILLPTTTTTTNANAIEHVDPRNRQRRRNRQQRCQQHPIIVLAAKKKKTKITNVDYHREQKEVGKGFGRQHYPIIRSPLVEDEIDVGSLNVCEQDHNGVDEIVDCTTHILSDTSNSSSNNSSSSVHANLLKWLSTHPNTYISSKFIVQPSSLGGGYGGFAHTAMSRNEVILQIPRSLCVTQDDALFDPIYGHVFQSIKDQRLSSWGMIILAGWIAKEYVIAQVMMLAPNNNNNNVYPKEARTNVNGRIKHNPYLHSLPWKRGGLFSQDHILFWSKDNVDMLLRGSKAYEDAMLIRNTVDDTIKKLSEDIVPMIIREVQNVHSMHDEAKAIDIRETYGSAVRGAFVIALSRSFAEEVEYSSDIRGNDVATNIEVENVLLPLVDILQHSNTPNTMLEPYDDYIILRARRNIRQGEELFHQYQEERENIIPPHKFFTRYGFIPGIKEPIVELLKRKSDLFF